MSFTPRTILAALDGSLRAPEVFEAAAALAKGFESKLFVFRMLVIPPDFPAAAANQAFMEDFNKRFAHPALNPHDAHRPLRPDETLQKVFTWQETRKVTRSLTLHYKRVMYILDPSDMARHAMGKHVTLYETEDGEVSIVHDGHELSARAFHKEGHVHQAAIVDNHLLDAALHYAKQLQQERDDKKLKSKAVTKRDKRLLRARQAEASALPV